MDIKKHHFFAFISRMKYINRWGLMRNTQSENIQEHSLQVAMIAHALAIIKNEIFEEYIDAQRVAVLGMFHDCNETITGDLPTPIKYFNIDIVKAYKKVEEISKNKLTVTDAKFFRLTENWLFPFLLLKIIMSKLL